MKLRISSHSHILVFGLVAGLASCGGGEKQPAPPVTPATDTPAPAPAPELPSGPDAEESLTWVLGKLESGGSVSVAEIDERFAPSFLKQVPPDKLAPLFAEAAKQLGGFKIIEKEGTPPLQITALLDTQSGVVRVILGLTATSPRKIETLLLKPASSEAPPTSYPMVVEQLKKAGETSQFYVAELVKGKCTPAQKHNVTQSMALGSSFKLYVLLGLSERIRKIKGTSWDTKLPIRDELKSLPSGVLQLQKAGTQLTLRELATKMMSISDNTATDHILDFVGRENVEKALRAARHGHPAANIPFLSTREMFALKLASTDAERDAYRKASVAGKRELLDAMRKKELNLGMAVDWKTPRDLDLEWFADARDICSAYAALSKAAGGDPSSELLTVLAVNPGVAFSKGDWKYLGFKGGSEPGVISLTWLGLRADDRWFVISVNVNDKTKALDEGAVVNAATGAITILGRERSADR